jgi:hypothetical protein
MDANTYRIVDFGNEEEDRDSTFLFSSFHLRLLYKQVGFLFRYGIKGK